MHIVVAVKQVPRQAELVLGEDLRLRRREVALEMSAYCRRAVAKGVELARATGGRCTVVSLGPPSAEQVLREALACGADQAVLLSDPVFAGSDTLVTAQALAALLEDQEPVDLVLVGRASLDAETGQVGPQLAELLDLPFAGAVRELEVDAEAGTARVRCEQDDGGCELLVRLPAVLAVAERLCHPAKADPDAVAAVATDRVQRRAADELVAHGPWGEPASPTRVTAIVAGASRGAAHICQGSLEEQVREAVERLGDLDAGPRQEATARGFAPEASLGADGAIVGVLAEPGRGRVVAELTGGAARLARELGARVTVLGPGRWSPEAVWSWGADELVELGETALEEDLARAVAGWAGEAAPGVVLAPATFWGRELAARVAARLGVGLLADVLDLGVVDGRLVCTKTACAGEALATVVSRSSVQMATVRPGALAVQGAREGSGRVGLTRLACPSRGRVEVLDRWRDDDLEALERAETVIGVGLGVEPEAYGELRRLAARLGAELGATRKVTDRGWLPRSRQIGVTGRGIAPRLYLAVGISGSVNHLAGVRRAGAVVAVNTDAAAPIFQSCDVGLVGDWREVLPELVRQLHAAVPTGLRGPVRP